MVAGLIVEGGRVLLTQRTAEQSMPLKWEFPGGKMEAGESPEEALARELQEEIGVQVEVGRVWDTLFVTYPDFDLLMLTYSCQLIGAKRPRCQEVADLAWVEPAAMVKLDILEADAPMVKRLLTEGPPCHSSQAI